MRLDDALDDVQPQTEALLARARVAHVAHLVEAVEDLRHVRCRDPRPVVLDGDEHEPTPLLRGDHHLAAVAAVALGVGEEVGEDLQDPVSIAEDRRRLRRHALADVQAPLEEPGRQTRQRLHDGLPQIERLERHRFARQLEPREVQQLLDECAQPLSRGARHLQALALALVDGSHLLRQEQLGVADHGHQRRTELVGDVGEEVVLAPVGLLQPLVRLAQHPGALLDGVLDHRRLLAHALPHHRPLERERGLQGERAEHSQVGFLAVPGRREKDPERVVCRAPQRGGHHLGEVEDLDQPLPGRLRRASSPDGAQQLMRAHFDDRLGRLEQRVEQRRLRRIDRH